VESLTTAEAVRELDLPYVARFLRLAERHGIEPIMSGPGIRGAKFWSPADIARLREILDAERAAEVAS
jgi:hypothetical protein